MPLKAILDSLEGVPEALHEHYTKTDDGKFRLDAEGVEDVTGLKSALDKERQERKAAKEKHESYKDVDLEEYQTLKKEATDRKEKKLLDSGKVEELIVERTARMKADYDKQVSTLHEQLQTQTSQLEALLVDNVLTAAANKAGVETSALEDVLRRGREIYKVADGQALPLNNDQVIIGKDGKSPMGMDEWLGELASSAPHLFKTSSGGGASHSPKPGSGGAPARKRSDMTPEQKAKYIGEHGRDAYLGLPA